MVVKLENKRAKDAKSVKAPLKNANKSINQALENKLKNRVDTGYGRCNV